MKVYVIIASMVVNSKQSNIFLYSSVVQLMTGKKLAFVKKKISKCKLQSNYPTSLFIPLSFNILPKALTTMQVQFITPL